MISSITPSPFLFFSFLIHTDSFSITIIGEHLWIWEVNFTVDLINLILFSSLSLVALPRALADFGNSCNPVCQPPDDCTWPYEYNCGLDLYMNLCLACIYVSIEGSHYEIRKVDESDEIGKEMCDACWENCNNSNMDVCRVLYTPMSTATATSLLRARGFMRGMFTWAGWDGMGALSTYNNHEHMMVSGRKD